MEGIAKTIDMNDLQLASKDQSFASSVQQAMQHYFAKLEGEEASNVYQMVLAQVEVPLLKTVMRYTNGNQSKAAKVLGLSRGTLRKKLAIYQLEEE